MNQLGTTKTVPTDTGWRSHDNRFVLFSRREGGNDFSNRYLWNAVFFLIFLVPDEYAHNPFTTKEKMVSAVCGRYCGEHKSSASREYPCAPSSPRQWPGLTKRIPQSYCQRAPPPFGFLVSFCATSNAHNFVTAGSARHLGGNAFVCTVRTKSRKTNICVVRLLSLLFCNALFQTKVVVLKQP